MTIFYIVAGICLMGILVALWLMQKEAEQATSVGIQKIAPEEIKAYDPQTETVNGGTLTTKQAPPKKAAKPKKSRVPLKGLFGKDTSGDISVRLDAIEAAPEMPESKPKKKSFFYNL